MGIAGAWKRAAEGRGGRVRAVDTAAAAAARGEERKAGAKGLRISFWKASFAYGKKGKKYCYEMVDPPMYGACSKGLPTKLLISCSCPCTFPFSISAPEAKNNCSISYPF